MFKYTIFLRITFQKNLKYKNSSITLLISQFMKILYLKFDT